MNAKVKQKFQSLEYQREYLFTLIDQIPTERANLRFEENSWSLAEVYYHLYLVEQKVFDDVAARIKHYNTAKKTGIKEEIRVSILKILLKLPFKYKAPRVVKESIPKDVNINNLRIDWDNLRQAFELLLNGNSDEDLKLKLFKHPVVGLMNIIQTLDFIKAHHKHHLSQVKNLLSKIKSD